MNTRPDANELLDRSAALLQSQSTLIDTLLRRCKDLHNDAEILRGTVKATVAERNELRANLANAERRADEMEGKAGEWIAVDVHKERMGGLAAFAKVAFNRAAKVEQKADGFWLMLPNVMIRVPEPRGDITYKNLIAAIEQQKQDRAILNTAGVEVSS